MELTTYLRFLVVLVFVLALIGLLAYILRRLGLGPRVTASGGKRRLSVVEISPLDGKRKLVLVRRDDREHLLLLGATGELVVETGIPPTDMSLPKARTDAAPALEVEASHGHSAAASGNDSTRQSPTLSTQEP